MQAPTIDVDEKALKSEADVFAALRDLATRIIGALRVYPHFVTLKGLAATDDRALAVALARLIATAPPLPPGISKERLMKVSFTKVKIDPEKAEAAGNSTAYSRTHQPLTLHTDSSYLPQPHPLVIFQFVRADLEGGETILGTVEDLVETLDEDTATALRQTPMPFGKGDAPVLFGSESAPCVRYYRNQIDNAVKVGCRLPETSKTVLDSLDMVLAEKMRTFRFRAESGDILFMHNQKVLHGRTGFASSSDRMMYRLRMFSGCLG